MVDREARNAAAEILRHFVSGQTFNFEFEDKEPVTKDAAVQAIWESMWPFYCDLRQHKMSGKWALPKETKHAISIWLLFLYSEEEYLWPKISLPGVRPLKYTLISRVFGLHRHEKTFMQSGDYAVWPFISRESFENAKHNPKLLAGS